MPFINFFFPLSSILFGIILLVRKEGTDPRPSPTKDCDDERNLDFIAWMGEMIIVNSPEDSGKLNQLLSTKKMLRLLLVHN